MPRLADGLAKAIQESQNLFRSNGDKYLNRTNTKPLQDFFAQNPNTNYLRRYQIALGNPAKEKAIREEYSRFLRNITDADSIVFIQTHYEYAANTFLYSSENFDESLRKFNNDRKKIRETIRAENTGEYSSVKLEHRQYSVQEIRDLFNSLNKDSDIPELADKVFSIAESLPIRIYGANASEMGRAFGDWTSAWQRVRYNISAFGKLGQTNQSKATCLLHEMIHAVTLYAVDRNNWNELTPEMRAAAEELHNIYHQLEYDADFKRQYGSKDVAEMIAELSNPGFREMLKKKSLWRKVVDSIRKLLGIDTDNAYERTIAALDYVLDNFDYSKWDDYSYRRGNQWLKKEADVSEEEKSERITEYLDDHPTDARYSIEDLPLARSLTYFAGGGTLDFALKGYTDNQLAVEFDEEVAGLFRLNNLGNLYAGDVRNAVKGIEKLRGTIDYFHASPVCHDFSGLKRKKDITEADLEADRTTAEATAVTLEKVLPKVFTLENVAAYQQSEFFKIITDKLEELGYTWDAKVYNAADFGAPTARPRLFLRAVLGEQLISQPEATTPKETRNTWWNAISDVFDELEDDKLPDWMQKRLDKMNTKIETPTLILYGDKSEGLSMFTWDKPAGTLRTKNEARIVMPDGTVKKVSAEAYKRIQGMDGYIIPPKSARKKTVSERVIGNGIPPQLTRAIVVPLLKSYIQGRAQDQDIRYSIDNIEGFDPYYDEVGDRAVMTMDRLNREIEYSGAGSKKNYAQSWITRINPTDFINLTTGVTQDREIFDQTEGDYGTTVKDYDFVEGLKKSKQTPYLMVDVNTLQVVGHEGRHRMRALEMRGIEDAEILVQFVSGPRRHLETAVNERNGRLETIPVSLTVANQVGTGQEASTIGGLYPLNNDHKDEILESFGEVNSNGQDIKYSVDSDEIKNTLAILPDVIANIKDVNGKTYTAVVKADYTEYVKQKRKSSLYSDYIYDKLAGRVITVMDENGYPQKIRFAEKTIG